MEKIRVLRILNRNSIGGPVLNAIYLNKFLGEQFETRLICGTLANEEVNADHLFERYGLKYESLPQLKRNINIFNDFRAFLHLRKIIKTYQPHVVHTHAAKAGALGRLASLGLGKKRPVVLHTFHGHVFHSYFNRIVTKCFILVERFLAAKSTRIVAISDSQRDELVNEYKIAAAGKVVTIPNGIDLDTFRINVAANRKQWRQQFEIRDDEIAVGIVGRLAPIKNHRLFIDVVAEVLKDHPAGVRFFIIGDGESKEDILQYIQSKRLKANYYPEDSASSGAQITLTSWQTNMAKVYAGLDIVCLSSLNEGTPIALMESYAAGVPAVSTDVGAVSDVIRDKETGYLVKDHSVTQFTAALNELINDPQKRAEMGRKGQAYIMEKYAYQRLVRDMQQLYLQLLQQKNNK